MLLALSFTALMPALTRAQAYPDRSIRTILTFPPGGGFDNIARLIAPFLGRALGQSVIVDNRPGATGQIGTAAAARAEPDGYTLLWGGVGAMAIAPHLGKLQYDPIKDFEPVSMVAVNDGLLVVNPQFPAKNLKEFISAVKQTPNKYSFASAGTGSVTHVIGELLKTRAGLDMVHIPYKGDGPAITDLIGGTVPIMVTVYATAAPYVKSGQVRAIAALGKTRFPQLPDLPTVDESGFPGLTGGSWLALYAPVGTPPSIVAKISAALQTALRNRDLVETLAEQGTKLSSSTPQELTAFTRDEFAKWGQVVRTNGIKLD
jgi:tripartite-type tricarboxylate transporter receptor subunit TctC